MSQSRAVRGAPRTCSDVRPSASSGDSAHGHAAVADLQRGFERLDEPRAFSARERDAVLHDLDRRLRARVDARVALRASRNVSTSLAAEVLRASAPGTSRAARAIAADARLALRARA